METRTVVAVSFTAFEGVPDAVVEVGRIVADETNLLPLDVKAMRHKQTSTITTTMVLRLPGGLTTSMNSLRVTETSFDPL